MIELLRKAWHLDPDFRLTHLVMVVSDKPNDLGTLWHVENDMMEEKLRSWIKGRSAFKSQQRRP